LLNPQNPPPRVPYEKSFEDLPGVGKRESHQPEGSSLATEHSLPLAGGPRPVQGNVKENNLQDLEELGDL